MPPAKKKTAKAKAAAKKTAKPAKKAPAVQAKGAKPSKVAKPISELKPGWTSRVFGIETARLQACDARWDGGNWERGDKFKFLYRSKRGKYFLLTDVQNWKILTDDEAKKLFKELPEKLVADKAAFEPIIIPPLPPASRDEDEDTRAYKVVRNDKWEFSIWLAYKEMPRGWYHIGVTGPKRSCLEFIEQNCVFGSPNPGIP